MPEEGDKEVLASDDPFNLLPTSYGVAVGIPFGLI